MDWDIHQQLVSVENSSDDGGMVGNEEMRAQSGSNTVGDGVKGNGVEDGGA